MLVLFLSNKYVRAVLGKASEERLEVEGLYHTVDASGCILNGAVTDEEPFLELMRKFWETNALPKKDVYLVLGGNQFTTRIIDVPVQSAGKTMEYVSREFSDIDRIADPVYSYFALPRKKDGAKKMRSVFAMVSPREYIRRFQEMFGKLGIAISGVEPATGALLRLLQKVPQLKDGTSIVQFADDITILNALFIEGENVYLGRNRLYADSGTAGYPVEAARGVSSILQFARAQDIAQEVQSVYISGLSEEDLPIYHDSVTMIEPALTSEELNISETVALSGADREELRVPGMLIALGALQKTDPRTGTIRQAARNPEREAVVNKRLRVLIPLGIIAVVMIGAALKVGMRHMSLRSQIAEIYAYNDDPAIVQIREEYSRISSDINVLASLRSGLSELSEKALSYPLVDSSTEEVLARCAGDLVTTRIQSYDAESGVLSFDADADDVEQLHQFVARLEQEAVFASVNYTGYAQDAAAGVWRAKINCTMQGRQEEEHDTESNGEG